MHIDLYEIVKGGRPVFLLFVAPLLVVPTELTEYTEAYGLIFFESTERIDATHHTTDYTEMIAFGDASNHFCGFLPREA